MNESVYLKRGRRLIEKYSLLVSTQLKCSLVELPRKFENKDQ